MAMRTGFDIELGVGEAAGRLFRAAPPGSPRARLVSRASDGGRVCLLVGRLHYKDDLVRRHPALACRTFAGDAELALAVFAAAGPRGLAGLEGEFSLVVGDPAQGHLYALRDPLGSWPLYWASRAGRLLAGTSLLDLARRLGGAPVNLDHLGAFLMWPFPGCELPREDTALEGIRRVPPGQLLRLDAAGRRLALHEHAWPAAGAESSLDGEAAASRFLELFRAAVRERLEPGTTAAHLSGGMDSSSVVCLARDLLRERAVRPLDTVSLVYRLPSLAGETDYIEVMLDQAGPLSPRFLDGDALYAFDWFSSGVPEHDEPYGGLHGLATETALARAADEAGAAAVLTGGGAEVVAEGMCDHVADLLRRGRCAAAVGEARAWARADSMSLWAVLGRHGLKPLLPGLFRDGVGTFLRRGQARWPAVGDSAVPPWVRPAFARERRLWRKGREAVGLLRRPPYEDSACRFYAACEVGDWSTWHLAGPRGLHTGRPFLDPRLIAFSLSLPHALRLRPGVPKPLLRSAMKGALPEPIRTRKWKGHFNDVYRLGLSRRLGALEAMVERSPIADLDLLDRAALRTALHQVAAGLGKVAAGTRLNSTLALIAWYDHLGPALARAADEPADVVRAGGKQTERSGHVLCG
jgi:asparagine synthase (glutamine-hydrolysing)